MIHRILGPISQLSCVGASLGESLRSVGVVRAVDIFFTSNEHAELIDVPCLSNTKRQAILTYVSQLLQPLTSLDYTDKYPQWPSFASSLCDLHAAEASIRKLERLLFDIYVARAIVRKFSSTTISFEESSSNHCRLHAYLISRLDASAKAIILQQAEEYVSTLSQNSTQRRAMMFMQQVLQCTTQFAVQHAKSALPQPSASISTPSRFPSRTAYVSSSDCDELSAAIAQLNIAPASPPITTDRPITAPPMISPAMRRVTPKQPSLFAPFHLPPIVDLTTTATTLVILDIETTGLSCDNNHIIQLAARIVYSDATSTELGPSFNSFINSPEVHVSSFITELTGITNEQLRAEGESLDVVWSNFVQWIATHAKHTDVVWLAHNGQKFDFKFIHKVLTRFGLDADYERKLNVKCHIDTLHVLRQPECWTVPPPSHKLGVLYEHAMKSPLPNAHNALGDVDGLAAILMEGVGDKWKAIANKFQFSLC